MPTPRSARSTTAAAVVSLSRARGEVGLRPRGALAGPRRVQQPARARPPARASRAVPRAMVGRHGPRAVPHGTDKFPARRRGRARRGVDVGRRIAYGRGHAHPAHLRLAHRPHLPRGRPAYRPGIGARRDRADRRRAPRGRRASSPGTCTTGRSRAPTRSRCATRVSSRSGRPVRRSSCPRATTIPPTRLGAGAAFTAAGGLHLRTRVADSGSARPARGSRTARSRSTGCLTSNRTSPGWNSTPRRHARTRRCSHAAMARVRADLARRPGVPLDRAGTRLRAGRRGHRFGAVHLRRRCRDGAGSAVFDGIDYVALGHLHSPQTTHRQACATPVPRCRTRSASARTARRSGCRPRRRRAAAVRRRDLPVVRGLSQLTGTLSTCCPRRERSRVPEDHYVSALLTDPVRP